MLLEEMVQMFWRDSTSLASAIPPERFSTGPGPIPGIPCVSFIPEKSELLLHTNREEPWRKMLVRFELRHDSYEEGKWLARLIRQSFDRLALRDPEGQWTFLFHFQREEESLENGKVRLFVVRFQLIG